MKRKKNLKKLLNLGMLDYTNLTPKIGKLDMPYVNCGRSIEIDYLATYSQPGTYRLTPNTAVAFFEYDAQFDGLYGLWNAIYYGVKELQEYYLERFSGVKLFIAPDYSKCGDNLKIENEHRQMRSRLVAIWLTMNLGAIVIPLVACDRLESMPDILEGMKDCHTIAFNAKGPMGDPNQLGIFLEAIHYTVDHLPALEMIIVNASSPDDEKVRNIFSYAIERGIRVQIPDNMLRSRNRLNGGSD